MKNSDTLKAAIRFLYETASAGEPVDDELARDFYRWAGLPGEPSTANLEAIKRALEAANS
jgi:hypothetical protein